MKPIPDKVEIVLEYPDKFYSGTFERSSHFTAHFDEGGVALAFSREGEDSERKSVRIHIHNALFAEILGELAKTVSAIAPDNVHGDARGMERPWKIDPVPFVLAADEWMALAEIVNPVRMTDLMAPGQG